MRDQTDVSRAWVKTLAPLEGRDIAEVIAFATGLPRNVNLASVVAMPTRQP